MPNIVPVPEEGRSLYDQNAAKAAMTIMKAGKAAEIAKRVKDPEALKRALLAKLDAERDFAGVYRQKFSQGQRSDLTPDNAVRSSADWCLSFGFHVRTVQRWLELLIQETYERKEESIFKKYWQLAELQQAANFSSDSNEWYTPAQYIAAVRETLGGIDLDPASNEQANATVQAAQFFTLEDDGLARDWVGRFFVNPPYGKTADGGSMAAAFCLKAIAEYTAKRATAGIILVNSLHSQAWQAPLYDFPVCFVDHRIKFVSGDGEENKNPTFQNIFIYLGDDVSAFATSFNQFGYVMTKWLP